MVSTQHNVIKMDIFIIFKLITLFSFEMLDELLIFSWLVGFAAGLCIIKICFHCSVV